MGSRMLHCTSLLARCVVVAGSSIACFVAVVMFVLAVGACSDLNPEAVERRCCAALSLINEA